MRSKFGVALAGTCLFLLSLSVLPVALLFTRDDVFRSKSGWIALAYITLLIGLISIGIWLTTSVGEELKIQPIEALVCLAINYLLAALMLDMGMISYATNRALIPYLALVVIILVRRWKKLTRIDKFLLSWSWIPLMLFMMPIVYRLRAGKDVW